MENKERQILSEIQAMMSSIRSQIEALDAKLSELQVNVGAEDVDMAPIDLELDEFQEFVEGSASEEIIVEEKPVQEVPAEEAVEVDVVDDDLPFDEPVVDEPSEDLVEPSFEETLDVNVEESSGEQVEPTVADPVVDVAVEAEVEVEAEPEIEEDDDLPIFAEPEPVREQPSIAVASKPAVIDSMTDKQAWRTDMPGTQVKDIRSAISLNDRILFINMLFDQDPMLFQDALTRINQMSSIEEVISYVSEERPQWELDSETVYRFMMAVRRKIR